MMTMVIVMMMEIEKVALIDGDDGDDVMMVIEILGNRGDGDAKDDVHCYMMMTMTMVMRVIMMMNILITLTNSFKYEIEIMYHFNLKSVSTKVDGGFTNWTNAGKCSKTCGGGTQKQTRTCSNPPPAYGGKNCTGETLRTINCGVSECPGT